MNRFYFDLIPEELAKKLLKINYPLLQVKIQNGDQFFYELSQDNPDWQNCKAWYIPTISEVLRWLRIEKLIFIFPQLGCISNNKQRYKAKIFIRNNKTKFEHTLDNDNFDFPTYEEALISGIEYTIDNLLNKS
jgi:hypothetical protein